MNELKQAMLLYYIFADNKQFQLNKTPNRVEIIRDFNHLIEDNINNFIENNQDTNNVNLSQDKLYSKLQKFIFNKISLINDHKQLKNILINDNSNINFNNVNNIYEIADIWCRNKYGLI